MARHKDAYWILEEGGERGALSRDQINIALLMDLRDELKKINRTLETIRKNTAKRRRKRKAK